jgi:hypothetical protein
MVYDPRPHRGRDPERDDLPGRDSTTGNAALADIISLGSNRTLDRYGSAVMQTKAENEARWMWIDDACSFARIGTNINARHVAS